MAHGRNAVRLSPRRRQTPGHRHRRGEMGEVDLRAAARTDAGGHFDVARALTERGVRQDHRPKATHHMLRRMVTHRVCLGAWPTTAKHFHPDAHPALIDPVLFEAANRAYSWRAAPARGAASTHRRLPRCAGCSTSSSRLITRAGDYRWLCRTLLAEQSATYRMPGSGTDSGLRARHPQAPGSGCREGSSPPASA